MEKKHLSRKTVLNVTSIGMFVAAIVIAVITFVMSTKMAEGGWAEFLHTLDRLQDFIISLENKYLTAQTDLSNAAQSQYILNALGRFVAYPPAAATTASAA